MPWESSQLLWMSVITHSFFLNYSHCIRKCESWWIEHWLHYDCVLKSYNLFLTGCPVSVVFTWPTCKKLYWKNLSVILNNSRFTGICLCGDICILQWSFFYSFFFLDWQTKFVTKLKYLLLIPEEASPHEELLSSNQVVIY